MVSQNVAATKAGGSIESGMMSDALEAVTNRSGTLSKNLAAGANIGRTNVLNEAKNKLAVRNSYLNAGANVLGSLANTGIRNIQGGGKFFYSK
jgi:IS5 family transposase